MGVGRLTSERREGDQTIAVWQADTPIRVAGFNYGNFRELASTDEATGIEIAVFTNPGSRDMAGQDWPSFPPP